MRRFSSLLNRFGRDESGVFAVLFGLMAIVLVALAGAVVDYVSLEQTRNRSQIALDAATLALQPESQLDNLTADELQKLAQDLVDNRVGAVGIVKLDKPVIDKTEGSLLFSASMTVDTAFVALVGVPTLSARIQSEVKRGSMDVEVAVAVDITGSMNDRVKVGTGWQTEAKIDSLKTALGQLIDLVVKDEQEPSHSKMAIAPYSMGVNLGGYASTIRGAVTMPTPITNIAWSTGGEKQITAAAKENPLKITAAAHGFADGDFVYISNVRGMTELNNKIYEVTGKTDDTFQLKGINGTSGYSTHNGSNGRVTKCLVKGCEMVVASVNHGLAAGDNAHLYGVRGMNSYNGNDASDYGYNRYNQYPTTDNTTYFNWINNNTGAGQYRFLTWKIGAVAQDTFVLEGTARTNGKNYGTYTGGGNAACVTPGCQYYLYQNQYNNNNSWRLQQISTCVTERATNTYTDESPATTLLGRNYPTSNNPCPNIGIQPLTDDKENLHNLAEALPAAGSTAGHLGIAWAWYMVSPNFGGPWPTENQPAPKTNKNVLRAVVLMTDGAFNTSYCNGVLSRQSGAGSGDENAKINCDSPNGDNAFDQAEKLCAAMKVADPAIRIYTVAFDVGDIADAQKVMANCASEPAFAFNAATGADLSDVFAKIGENLAFLRVTR